MTRLLLALLLLISIPARAAEPYTFSPDHCGFTVTLPEKPYSVTKCEKARPDQCYDLNTYTQVFSMDTSLRVDIICNAIAPNVVERYDLDVMKATLSAMTDKSVITTRETYTREEESYKQATLLGEGLQGRTPTLFIAQLWIDDTSAFSIEAEIVGAALEEADSIFSDILRSIQPKVKEAAQPAEDAGSAEESEE